MVAWLPVAFAAAECCNSVSVLRLHEPDCQSP